MSEVINESINLFITFVLLRYFVKPLRFGKIFKLIIAVIVVLNFFNMTMYSFFKYTVAQSGAPLALYLFLEITFFSTLFLFMLVVCRIILVFCLKKTSLTRIVQYCEASKASTALIMMFFSVGISAYGVLNTLNPAIDVFYTLKIDKLQQEDAGFKIVEISDLHIDKLTSCDDIQNIVDRVNAHKPDMIIIAGDIADGMVSDLKDKTDLLFSLKSRYGIYAVSGNHEMYFDYHGWLSYLEKGGIHFLENKSYLLKDDNGREIMNLCGISDKKGKKIGLPKPNPQLACRDIKINLPTVFLSHRPAYAYDAKEFASLTLSGHTHGGLMPLLDILVGIQNKGKVHGLYQIDNEYLIVSRGTMINSASAFRILNPATIEIVTLIPD